MRMHCCTNKVAHSALCFPSRAPKIQSIYIDQMTMLCGGPPKLPSFKADSPLSTPFMKSIADLFRCISVTRFTQVIFKSRNLVTLRSRIAVLKRERGDFVTSGFIAIFKGCCIYYQ